MSTIPIIERIQDVEQIVRRCPTVTLVRAYARAARQLCVESRWLRVQASSTTVPGLQRYSLGNDPWLDILNLHAVEIGDAGNISPLRVWDPRQWNPNNAPGRPAFYAYVPEAQFVLYPVPDKEYQITASIEVAPKAGATQLPDILFNKWEQAMQDGALAYLLSIPGEPWSNPQMAMIYERRYRAAISNAKTDVQRLYQNGSLRARTPRIF